MRTWIQNQPIRKKLILVILSACTAVLIAVCASLAVYEVTNFRRTIARDTTVLADILAKNTRAALAFQDETAAAEILGALQAEPHIVGACLYNADGVRFADYVRPDSIFEFPAAPEADGARFVDGRLVVFRPVGLQGKRIGVIHLRGDLGGLHERLRHFAGIVAFTLVGALALAFVLAAWMQRPIADPILSLAATAQLIAERKDYSVRALKHGRHEIGALTGAFNEMLEGIQERERALDQSNRALQAEVGERRLAQSLVQAQLARLAQLHEITRATGERQDIRSIFQVVVRSLEEHLPADFACICRHDETAGRLIVSSLGGCSAELAGRLGLGERAEIPVAESGLSACVRGELVHAADLAGLDLPFPRRLRDGGLRALVAAPLIIESGAFGVLIAARRDTGGFSDGEREFIKQLSEHVALSAHQAQLYEALQKAYDDLRQSQQAILQQERLRALGQMASGIAHDINNAISPVTLYTDFLLEVEPGLSPRARDCLTTIQRAMGDVSQTVSRMREFYRLREPQAAATAVDLNTIVPQVIDLTRARWSNMLQASGIVVELRTEFTPGLPAVLGFESEIREALTNLIFNAIDAMPVGGVLTLRTATRRDRTDRIAERPRQVVVEVTDTGQGMDEDTRRRCMEPFFTTKGERGTGLGLAMVYGTLQRHNAEVEIDSQPGRGTTFRLLFPVPDEQATAASLEQTPALTIGPRRLLVIDDDPLVTRSLGDILAADGHEVVTASGGRAGVELFQRSLQDGARPFFCVITDLGMPHMDGRKVAAEIKAASPRTPIIMLTGWGERMMADGDMPPHVDLMLGKPPKLHDLRTAFAKLLVTPARP